MECSHCVEVVMHDDVPNVVLQSNDVCMMRLTYALKTRAMYVPMCIMHSMYVLQSNAMYVPTSQHHSKQVRHQQHIKLHAQHPFLFRGSGCGGVM